MSKSVDLGRNLVTRDTGIDGSLITRRQGAGSRVFSRPGRSRKVAARYKDVVAARDPWEVDLASGGAKSGEKMTKSRTGRYKALVTSPQRAASPGRIVGMGSASGRGLMRS